jgi:hypothetical protein
LRDLTFYRDPPVALQLPTPAVSVAGQTQ